MPQFLFRNQPIHYTLNGSGATLLLVHGAGGNGMNWPSALRRLPGWRVAALDLPGHGKSASAAPLADVADFAELVVSLADALDAEHFALAGQSLGAAIALQGALVVGDRVTHLALLNGAARIDVSPGLLEMLRQGDPVAYPVLTRLSYARSTPADKLARYEAHLRKTPAPALWGAFNACATFDVTKRVAALHVPALLLASDKDRMIPAEATRDLAALLPNARLQMVANTGHMIHIEAPAATTNAIAAFLNAK